QGSFVPFALTHNQRSAALMADAQYAAWGATGLVNYLDTLSAAQLPAVLGSLSGEQHTHGQSMARRLGTQFNSLLLSRLDDADGEHSHGWNFWLKGLGGFGGLDSDGNADRADNHSGGFALGADTRLGDRAVLGVAASYVRSNVDAVTANLDMDSYQLSGYGKWHRDGNYVKGTLGAGFHQTGSRRTVLSDSASANYGSSTAGTALEAGRNIALLETATLTPYAGMQYLHLNRNNFTETGSNLANLKVREADEDSFRTLLGARLSQVVKAGWGMSIQPSLHAAWVYEHGDRVSRLAADFAAAPAAVYRVNGPQLDRSRAAVGADLVTRFSETAQLNVAYNAELAKSDDWHTLSATFEYRW
ncbi:MAG: autotransporter outer membrane beta-barrel domain-containing protein, partial [Methylobacter sp.]|nr:autotransporter outer membrane beta-barrel domain-containing protein [Methylobacter sp.]